VTQIRRVLVIGICVLCRAVGWVEAHHPTARDAAGRHLDEQWTVALCRACHSDLHRLWTEAGLFDLRAEPGVLRRHRTLSLIDLFAERSPVLNQEERQMLAVAVQVLGQTDPWREVSRA